MGAQLSTDAISSDAVSGDSTCRSFARMMKVVGGLLILLAALPSCGDGRDHAIRSEAGAIDAVDSMPAQDAPVDPAGAHDGHMVDVSTEIPIVADAPTTVDSEPQITDANETGASRRGAGASCSSGSECESGFCTDGQCCLVNKCDTCRRCGTDGRCTVRISEGMEDAANGCFGRKACDRDGECRTKTDELCTAHSDCITRYCGILFASDNSYKRVCRECGKWTSSAARSHNHAAMGWCVFRRKSSRTVRIFDT